MSSVPGSMQRTRLAREVALLMAPLVIIAVVGVLATARYWKINERNSGPLRTVIVGITRQKVTPLEAWQGIDSKWVIHTNMEGERPLRLGYRFDYWRTDENVHIFEPKGAREKTHKGLTRSGASFGAGNTGDFTSSLLVKTRGLAPKPVRLRGQTTARGLLTPLSAGQPDIEVVSRPALIDIPLRGRENAADTVDKKAPVVLSTVVEKGTVLPGLVTVKARVRAPQWNDVSSREWSCHQTLVRDANGELVPISTPFDVMRRRFNPDGASTFSATLNISKVSIARGRLTYEGWLSCENSWPVKVTAVLRE